MFEQIMAMKQELLLIIVFAVIAFMSIVAFILYGVDKRKAKREAWRIPEAVLLGWGFFGGACGALCRFLLGGVKAKMRSVGTRQRDEIAYCGHQKRKLCDELGTLLRKGGDERQELALAFTGKAGIDHGGGLCTVYAHLDSIAVVQGQLVSNGQQIGRVGNSGYSKGPHLHFEVIKNGVRVNPNKYLQP